MERPQLRHARESRDWTQEELAEKIGVTALTIHNWEKGTSTPSARNRRALCQLFGCEPEAINLARPEAPPPEPPDKHMKHPSHHFTLPDTMQDFLACHLLTLAHTRYSTPDEMTDAIRNAIEKFDMIHPGETISRRDALCLLASLPMSALGTHSTLESRHYDQMLRHATAALEACWQLYRDSDTIGVQHAFKCVGVCVPMLETIAHNSSQHRKQALDLAARYAILQTLLSWEYLPPWESVSYAQRALDLSRETGNILLQMSARPKLAWTYIRNKQHKRAWETMQAGERALKQYQQAKRGVPLPSGIIGNFYSSYCQAQIKNGLAPDIALGIVVDSEPLQKSMAFVQFEASGQWWEVAWAYAAKGDPAQAMVWLEKLIDPEMLVVQPGVSHLSESERIGAINIMTSALLQSPGRNLEKIIHAWEVGMEEAQTLKHEVMYDEAMTNYEIMKVLYPGEQAIRKLAPLTEHW